MSTSDASIRHNQQRRQLNGACASFITIIAYADSRSTATGECVATQLNFSLRRKLARKAAGRWSCRSREAPRLTFMYYYKWQREFPGAASPRRRDASCTSMHVHLLFTCVDVRSGKKDKLPFLNVLRDVEGHRPQWLAANYA